MFLQNTNDHNVWIRQPLYAGDLWDTDKEDWEYEPVLVKDAETNNITVKFQQVPPEHIRQEIFSQTTEMFGPDKTDKDKETETKEKEKESYPQPTSEDSANQEQPKFGPRPDTSSADFDFKMELKRLPFTINIGEAPLSREQQSRFIDLITTTRRSFLSMMVTSGFVTLLNTLYLPLQISLYTCLIDRFPSSYNKR